MPAVIAAQNGIKTINTSANVHLVHGHYDSSLLRNEAGVALWHSTVLVLVLVPGRLFDFLAFTLHAGIALHCLVLALACSFDLLAFACSCSSSYSMASAVGVHVGRVVFMRSWRSCQLVYL